ncbi:MAG TPA: SDR family oxidoreductase [Roseiarcus sp.]|nr:SDR family oxidoreductase [Roseiarcus sp.]
MSHDHRIALVTGASRGIGRATAKAFLDRGMRVAVNGRTIESVSTAIAELGGGDRLVAAPGDIATVAGCESAVTATIKAFGSLDVLVNNAGVYTRTPIAGSDEQLWDWVMDANVKGVFFCGRAALDALRASRGVIVNVASEAGLRGYGGITIYCASKGAVVNLTRAMALELAPDVRVNCVCPGVVDTDMSRNISPDFQRESADFYPMKRIATANEVAQAIVYLASEDAGFITGTALAIDGGANAGG